MRRNLPRQQPSHCSCQSGAHAAREHVSHSAPDHGNPFAHSGACVHDQLNATTRPLPKKAHVQKIKLQ